MRRDVSRSSASRPRAFAAALTIALGLGARADAAEPLRLVGLERLYFERLSEKGSEPIRAEALRAAFPAALGDSPKLEAEVAVADFTLPGSPKGATLVLREARDARSRIHGVGWALYVNGRRGEIWFFAADPSRTDGKLLTNPAIGAVRRVSETELAVDVLGTMQRPGGAFAFTAWTLTLDVSASALTVRNVEERWGFSRGYELGDAPPEIAVWLARRNGDVVEVKTARDVAPSLLNACGYADPIEDSPHPPSASFADVARCVLEKSPGAVRKTRRLDEPAFLERGRKPAR